jgi:hypothetical protein
MNHRILRGAELVTKSSVYVLPCELAGRLDRSGIRKQP